MEVRHSLLYYVLLIILILKAFITIVYEWMMYTNNIATLIFMFLQISSNQHVGNIVNDSYISRELMNMSIFNHYNLYKV